MQKSENAQNNKHVGNMFFLSLNFLKVIVRDKGQLFFTEEFQLINVKIIREIYQH